MDSTAVQDVLGRRIEMEFREMPDLRLTLWQAGRLWNVPSDVCEAALTELVRSGFLRQGKDGRFLRT